MLGFGLIIEPLCAVVELAWGKICNPLGIPMSLSVVGVSLQS